MKILVTGAQGYLGALLCAELRSKHNVVGTSHRASLASDGPPLDITDPAMVTECFAGVAPDVVIHAAAIASVATCEKDPAAAFKTNAEGTSNIARAANEVGARVILVSSLAARNPLTVYGRSKQAAERHIQTVSAGHEIVQLSMTFGLSPNTTSHRPFNKILNTMRTGLPNLYDNVWRFQPTHTEHFVSVINRILEQGFMGRCLAVTTKEACTMYQIASDVLGPALVKGAHLYPERAEQLVDSEVLSLLGFSVCSYSLMITRLKEQLAAARSSWLPGTGFRGHST